MVTPLEWYEANERAFDKTGIIKKFSAFGITWKLSATIVYALLVLLKVFASIYG